MKNLLIAFYVISLCLSSAYGPCGKTDHVVIDVDSSTKFSETEIYAAINCVKEKFKDFKGCNLTKIWYDEVKSNKEIESYMSCGMGSVNGVSKDNVIVLFSDFTVDSSGGDGSLEPNSTYTDWNWILTRDSSTGKWKVDDWGY